MTPLKPVTISDTKEAGVHASMRSDRILSSDRTKSLRPDADTLDPDIPLFLIGKDKDGFWVALEAHNCAGGIFFTERGARKFAKHWAGPRGCATMAVSEPVELDFRGEGNVLIPLIKALKPKATYRLPSPVLDVLTIVLGLASVATAIWLTIGLLMLGR